MRTRRGSAYIITMALASLIAIAALSYVDASTKELRDARRRGQDNAMSHLCDAGAQDCLKGFWKTFKTTQSFSNLDAVCGSASAVVPKGAVSDAIDGVGRYTAAIIHCAQPGTDTYTRDVTVRTLGWLDTNSNGVLDSDEPVKVVDVKVEFKLMRSSVFDYVKFTNNYGYATGFSPQTLIINGDIKSNGDHTMLSGTFTNNGSLVACPNAKLDSGVTGLISGIPVKWSSTTYETNQANKKATADNEARWRQAYDPLKHGTRNSPQYQLWKDIIFDSDASVVSGEVDGAVLKDKNGSKAWSLEKIGDPLSTTLLDAESAQETVMPDLSDISSYQTLSSTYKDDKASYLDGTANPNYNQGAYIDVWNSTTNAYQRITTNGNVVGSAIMVGTSAHPIKIHGPVTISQDAVIKGYVSGQGTIYTGRNVHVVGSLRYTTPPDFRGTSPTDIDDQNEQADVLGLAARGSVIFGDPSQFNANTLKYMTPPFTKPRLDDNGNTIPAYDATSVDYTGTMRYKSVLGDAALKKVAEDVNQVDAIVYTNNLSGGELGKGGNGVILNGSVICKDSAHSHFSGPSYRNYDPRIKERSSTQKPLIDIVLPRSPALVFGTWQSKGVKYAL
ncbi:MAG: hypothetical protein JST12_03270 [Armatimonadetes bacterium]|nr:hypothetical protein [Armatimonadota bacterium]